MEGAAEAGSCAIIAPPLPAGILRPSSPCRGSSLSGRPPAWPPRLAPLPVPPPSPQPYAASQRRYADAPERVTAAPRPPPARYRRSRATAARASTPLVDPSSCATPVGYVLRCSPASRLRPPADSLAESPRAQL